MSVLSLGLKLSDFIGAYILLCVIFSSIKWFQSVTQMLKRAPKNLFDLIPQLMDTPVQLKNISVLHILVECFNHDGDISCIHHRFTNVKPCGNFSRKMYKDAQSVHRMCLVTIHPGRTPIRGLLDEYAQRCLCHVHEKLVNENQAFWVDQIERWLRELEGIYHEELDMILSTLPPGRQKRVLNLISPEPESQKPRYKSDMPGDFPASQPTEMDEESEIEAPKEEGPLSTSDEDFIALLKEKYQSRFSLPSPVLLSNDENDKGVLEDFAMYISSKNELLSDMIMHKLSDAEMGSGHVYIYQTVTEAQASAPTHVKIGFSTVSAETRIQSWKDKCRHDIELIDCFDTIHAKRVEALIFKELELIGKRRLDNRCRLSPGPCKRTHDEWFEIGGDEAIRVVRHWTSWMKFHKPYTATGTLEQEKALEMYAPRDSTVRKEPEAGDGSSVYGDFLMNSRGDQWFSYSGITGRAKPGDTPKGKGRSKASTSVMSKAAPETPEQKALSRTSDVPDLTERVASSQLRSRTRSNLNPSNSSRNTSSGISNKDQDDPFGPQDAQQSPSPSPCASKNRTSRRSTEPQLPPDDRKALEQEDSVTTGTNSKYLTPQRPIDHLNQTRKAASDSRVTTRSQRS